MPRARDEFDDELRPYESDEEDFDDADKSDGDEADDCPSCGRSISILIDYCPHCGHFVTDEPPRRRPKFLLIALGAIAGILITWRCLG